MIHNEITFKAYTSDIFSQLTETIQSLTEKNITVTPDALNELVEITFSNGAQGKRFETQNRAVELLRQNGLDVIYTEQTSTRQVVGTKEQRQRYWDSMFFNPRPSIAS